MMVRKALSDYFFLFMSLAHLLWDNERKKEIISINHIKLLILNNKKNVEKTLTEKHLCIKLKKKFRGVYGRLNMEMNKSYTQHKIHFVF